MLRWMLRYWSLRRHAHTCLDDYLCREKPQHRHKGVSRRIETMDAEAL